MHEVIVFPEETFNEPMLSGPRDERSILIHNEAGLG